MLHNINGSHDKQTTFSAKISKDNYILSITRRINAHISSSFRLSMVVRYYGYIAQCKVPTIKLGAEHKEIMKDARQ